MNGMEKITARMKDDAARSIEELNEQTERELQRLREESAARAEKEREAAAERARLAAQERYERLCSAAEMEKRKMALAARQEVLGETYVRALEILCSMPREDYLALLIKLLRAAGVDPAGRRAVIVGRSNIVGKPMALLLLQADATVTVCHSRTPDLADECRRADILISAVGRRGLITADMIKPGAAVVDVAMNRDEDGKLCGDVDFAAAEPLVGAITPVPGGVGAVTTAVLAAHVVQAAEKAAGLPEEEE